MAELNIETVIKSGVEKALNKPIVDGKSITEWAAIGMKASRWISVKDRLPEEDSYALVCNKQGIVFSDWFKFGAWQLGSVNVTHWMPLPEPPEEVSGDAD